MSLPVYTVVMYEKHALSSDSFTVPEGFSWVATTFSVFYPGGEIAPGVQLVDSVTSGTVFWDSAQSSTVGVWRPFTPGRLVLQSGREYLVSGLGSPDLLICGYQLSLP